MDNLALKEPAIEPIIKQVPESNTKQKAFLDLVEAGHSVASAERTVGYSANYGYDILKKIKNTSYINPARTKKVLTTFDSLLKDGKDATRAVLVKDYMARYSPIATVNLHLKADITPTDLSPFLNSPNKAPRDMNEANPAPTSLDIEKVSPQALNQSSEGI